MTVTAGSGLAGGGQLGTANQTGATSVTLTHADTSSQASINNSGNTFIQDLTFDTYGHVTGATSGTVTVGDGAMTVTAGTDLSGGGQVGTANQSTATSVTVNHANITRTNTTSTTAPAHGGTFTAIDSVTTNARGHVTGANTKTVTLPAQYVHPTYAGDDINVDTGALTGAVVVSDIDFNVTTDTQGHVTDANGAVVTRTLTLADLGFTGATNANYYTYTHPTHPGDDFSVDTGALTGAAVVSRVDINVTTDTAGHVTDANGSVTTRNLTAADIGAAASSHTHSNYLATTGGTLTGTLTGTTFKSNATSENARATGYKIANGTDIGECDRSTQYYDDRAANCNGYLPTGNCNGNTTWNPPDGNWWTWGATGVPTGICANYSSYNASVTTSYTAVSVAYNYDAYYEYASEIGGSEQHRWYRNCNCGSFNCRTNCNCNCY
jgi:hypothetical protein